MNFFNYEGPFFNVINRLADLVILNVLWLLCCLPIVTIGASTTAMFYVTMKIVNDEDAYIAKNFFKSFKENFRQSTIIWLIMLVIGIILIGDYYILPNMQLSDTLYNIAFSLFCLSALVYGMILMFLFPLQAKFKNKIKHTFKNAILLSIRHLPTSILLLAILILTLAAVFWSSSVIPQLFFVWILIAFSAIAFGCSFLYCRIFNMYITKNVEELEEVEEEAGEEV